MNQLGEYEARVLWGLPPRLRGLVVENLDDPESRGILVGLLRTRNPARSLARRLSEELSEEISSGMGFSLKKAFKSVAKVVAPIKRVVKRVVPKPILKVVKKVGKIAVVTSPAGLITKLATDRGFRERLAMNPLVQTAIPVVGGILAPFTFGASAAIAAALSGGSKVIATRKLAAEAVKAQRADAAQLQAEVAAQEADTMRQADQIYASNVETFTAQGCPPDLWAKLSLDAKLGAIDAVSKGQRVPGTPEASAGPPGAYSLVVEGQEVAKAATLEEMSSLAAQRVSTGQRFEVLFNGQSTGLRIATAQGAVQVPPDQEQEVRAMSGTQVDQLVDRATEAAAGEKKPINWWIVGPLAAGGAILAIKGGGA